MPPQTTQTTESLPTPPRLWPGVVVAILALWANQAAADTWIDTHDEPAPAWQLDTSGGARQLARERVRVRGPRGEEIGAERLAYAAAPGTVVWAWRQMPPAAVIEELRLELSARLTVPGARLAAEVILPHSQDDEGRPVRLRVRSSPSNGAADAVLTLEQLPKLVQREVRVWRLANRGKPIDPRGAYVARLGLALPGAGGAAQAWVQEIRVESLVAPLTLTDKGLIVRSVDPDDPDADFAPTASGRLEPTEVTLRSDGFRVDGKLFFPRVWRWRGESLRSLAERGINTVWFPGQPTKAALAEAAQHKLRLLCPPPPHGTTPTTTPDRILAWVLDGPLDATDLDAALVQIEAIRAITGRAKRPLLAVVKDDAAIWARVVDGVVIDASVSRTTLARLGTTTTTPDALRVPPSTPILSTVSLEVSPQVAGQLDALLGDGVAITWLPPTDTAAAVHRAIHQSVCGIAFTATERIDGADDASRAAAGWLEATNRRLRLIEPWLVGPRSTRPLDRHDGVFIDRGGVRLAAFSPFQTDAHGEDATVLLPGLNASARVSRLTVGGLNSWVTERVTGGIGVRRPAASSPGDLLMSNDPRVARSLQNYVRETSAGAAKELAEIATIHLQRSRALTPEARRQAEAKLAESRLAGSRRDTPVAYDAAHAALALVVEADARHRQLATSTETLESTPLTILPGTLVDHFRMAQLLATVPRGENRLFGGSFEDIDDLRRHGWRHTTPPRGLEPSDGAVPTGVELAAANPIHGQRVLRLSRAGSQIKSPEVTVAAGETIEVSGWARVTAGTDGHLRISDTLGGSELALEVTDTGGAWKPFRLLRASSAATTTQLAFEATGSITADIDGVMLRTVRPTGLASRPRSTK